LIRYTITIKRSIKDGDLTFTGGVKTITAKCYWNPTKKIPAGTYSGCSATTMANKKNSKGMPREAIFIPNVKGYVGIFIHMGKPPYQSWSDGCIVLDEKKIIEIYNAILLKDGHNVKIVITG
jgi:hypothetical protein